LVLSKQNRKESEQSKKNKIFGDLSVMNGGDNYEILGDFRQRREVGPIDVKRILQIALPKLLIAISFLLSGMSSPCPSI
jgi:hypothetical protein